MATTIVILGAGWAGLPLAHKLLKYTLPKSKGRLKVILVSPNSHFYWNLAAVRAVIPGMIPDEQILLPIQKALAQYSPKNFEFVLAKAERIDPEKNVVAIANNDGTQSCLAYDQLVIATGSQIRSNLPFKSIGTHEETVAALHSLQQQVGAAHSIVIAGGGPTSVETAGEIAARYGGGKDVTLVVGGKHVLEASHGVLTGVVKTVENDLQKLGEKLVHNAHVKDAQTNAPGGEGAHAQTTLVLSNGSTLVADLYMPLFGVQVNTGFVPASLLDDSGNVVLEKTMRVVGTKNIWGIGDVGNLEVKQVTVVDAQIIYLSGTLDLVLTGQEEKVKEYTPSPKFMLFVTMGKKYATGQIGNWKLWEWITAYVKGRHIFVDTAEGYVGGKHLRHSSM